MSSFKLDDDGDLAVENNKTFIKIESTDEVAQRLRCNLRAIRGEWFLDRRIGVPYREEVWVKNNTLTRVAAAFITDIRETPGVLTLEAFDQSIDPATREHTVNFRVEATSGEVIDLSHSQEASA
jgi:hypothetical protein